MPTGEVVETEPTLAVKVRVLAVAEVRLCRIGWQWLAPRPLPRCPGSVPIALAEVEEALETTEASWAVRRTESSRARRFT
jgi:hypothetical protein